MVHPVKAYFRVKKRISHARAEAALEARRAPGKELRRQAWKPLALL